MLNLCVLKAWSQGLWPKACEPSFVTQALLLKLMLRSYDSSIVIQALWITLCVSSFVTYALETHALCLMLVFKFCDVIIFTSFNTIIGNNFDQTFLWFFFRVDISNKRANAKAVTYLLPVCLAAKFLGVPTLAKYDAEQTDFSGSYSSSASRSILIHSNLNCELLLKRTTFSSFACYV